MHTCTHTCIDPCVPMRHAHATCPTHTHTHLYSLTPLPKDTVRASKLQMFVPVGISQLCQEHRQICSPHPSFLSSRYELSMYAQREHGPHESRDVQFHRTVWSGWRGLEWTRHTNCPKSPSTITREAQDCKGPTEGLLILECCHMAQLPPPHRLSSTQC